MFRGTDSSTWRPEDFFVAAAASGLAVTFTGLAARAGLTYTRLTASLGNGGRTLRLHTALLYTEVETDAADEARQLAKQADDAPVRSCVLTLGRRNAQECLREGRCADLV